MTVLAFASKLLSWSVHCCFESFPFKPKVLLRSLVLPFLEEVAGLVYKSRLVNFQAFSSERRALK